MNETNNDKQPHSEKLKITFFQSFEEAEDFGRQKMALMTPTERLLNLEKLRDMARQMRPNTENKHESNQMVLTIEFGEK